MGDNGQKVAIITGSSHGIGAGLTDAYRLRGWAVVGNSLTGKPSDDAEVLVVDGDISGPGTAERIVTEALERFGRIDTLINNAGVFVSKPFTEYTAADYALVVGVNVSGFFMLTQRVIGEMLERGGGHVVNITTTLVDYADSTVPAALTALTKGGLASATRSLAIEYAARGIRVNAISPGVIQSSMRDPDAYAALGALQPIGRVGQVRDIVDGVLFLESSPFVTGEIIHIDGGRIAGHSVGRESWTAPRTSTRPSRGIAIRRTMLMTRPLSSLHRRGLADPIRGTVTDRPRPKLHAAPPWRDPSRGESHSSRRAGRATARRPTAAPRTSSRCRCCERRAPA